MRLHLELEFEVDYSEVGDNRVVLSSVAFPGSSQNLMPFMSAAEIIRAQAELEWAHEQAAIAKADAIRERREMRGDRLRDMAKDERARA